MADRLLVDLAGNTTDTGKVTVSVWRDGELAPAPVGEPHQVAWPMDQQALEELRWYVEDYLRLPYGVYEQRGPTVASQLRGWGQALFAALFGSTEAQRAYAALRERATTELLVRSDSPVWLGLPWELAWDPQRPAPVALEFTAVSRMLLPAASQPSAAPVPGERLRVLLVIARPQGLEDVGYRMIARPLLERLELVRGKVELEVLRPPSRRSSGRSGRQPRPERPTSWSTSTATASWPAEPVAAAAPRGHAPRCSSAPSLRQGCWRLRPTAAART